MSQQATATATPGADVELGHGLYVIFDGPPAHESGRFVELEDNHRRGVGPSGSGADWVELPDGLWALGPFQRSPRPLPDDATALDRFIDLTDRKRELERELRLIKSELGDDTQGLMLDLLEEFKERGVTGERHAATGKLASITRRVWARCARDGSEPTPEEKQRAAKALREAGLGDFLEETFNVNSLSSHFREQVKARAEQGDPVTDLTELLPEPLQGAIELIEDHRISVRS